MQLLMLLVNNKKKLFIINIIKMVRLYINTTKDIIENCKNSDDINSIISSIFLALFVSDGASRKLMNDIPRLNELKQEESLNDKELCNDSLGIINDLTGGKGQKRRKLYGGNTNNQLKNEITYSDVKDFDEIEKKFTKIGNSLIKNRNKAVSNILNDTKKKMKAYKNSDDDIENINNAEKNMLKEENEKLNKKLGLNEDLESKQVIPENWEIENWKFSEDDEKNQLKPYIEKVQNNNDTRLQETVKGLSENEQQINQPENPKKQEQLKTIDVFKQKWNDAGEDLKKKFSDAKDLGVQFQQGWNKGWNNAGEYSKDLKKKLSEAETNVQESILNVQTIERYIDYVDDLVKNANTDITNKTDIYKLLDDAKEKIKVVKTNAETTKNLIDNERRFRLNDSQLAVGAKNLSQFTDLKWLDGVEKQKTKINNLVTDINNLVNEIKKEIEKAENKIKEAENKNPTTQNNTAKKQPKNQRQSSKSDTATPTTPTTPVQPAEKNSDRVTLRAPPITNKQPKTIQKPEQPTQNNTSNQTEKPKEKTEQQKQKEKQVQLKHNILAKGVTKGVTVAAKTVRAPFSVVYNTAKDLVIGDEKDQFNRNLKRLKEKLNDPNIDDEIDKELKEEIKDELSKINTKKPTKKDLQYINEILKDLNYTDNTVRNVALTVAGIGVAAGTAFAINKFYLQKQKQLYSILNMSNDNYNSTIENQLMDKFERLFNNEALKNIMQPKCLFMRTNSENKGLYFDTFNLTIRDLNPNFANIFLNKKLKGDALVLRLDSAINVENNPKKINFKKPEIIFVRYIHKKKNNLELCPKYNNNELKESFKYNGHTYKVDSMILSDFNKMNSLLIGVTSDNNQYVFIPDCQDTQVLEHDWFKKNNTLSLCFDPTTTCTGKTDLDVDFKNKNLTSIAHVQTCFNKLRRNRIFVYVKQ
jgi:hypothetical protein